MRRKKQEKSSKINIIMILAVITTMIVLIFTMAKYSSATKSESKTTVATPVLVLGSTDTLELEINPADEQKEFVFQVANYEGSNTSKVSMSYYLEIATLSNLPLEFELYEYDSETGTTGSNLLTGSGNVTASYTISTGTATADTYALLIDWDEDDTSYKYADEIDYIEIILHGTQKD